MDLRNALNDFVTQGRELFLRLQSQEVDELAKAELATLRVEFELQVPHNEANLLLNKRALENYPELPKGH